MDVIIFLVLKSFLKDHKSSHLFVLAPSKPQNISAVVLSPTLGEVQWSPPKKLNGLIVHYEVHWQTNSTLSGVRQKGELSVNDSEVLSTFLNKLSPNETYTVWVRVYSEDNETSTDSDQVQITTYPEPSNLVLLNKTAYTINLTWEIAEHIEKYEMQYALLTSNDWKNVTLIKNKDAVLATVSNLTPKTYYKFRLCINYKRNENLYVWPTDSRFSFETLGKYINEF